MADNDPPAEETATAPVRTLPRENHGNEETKLDKYHDDELENFTNLMDESAIFDTTMTDGTTRPTTDHQATNDATATGTTGTGQPSETMTPSQTKTTTETLVPTPGQMFDMMKSQICFDFIPHKDEVARFVFKNDEGSGYQEITTGQ